MKLSLVLIFYRSDSSKAKEASKFCEEILKAKNIKSNRIESDFQKDEIEKYLSSSESQPNIGIVLGGDGTFLKCANALAHYDIPLLSINIGGNLGFLTQEKDFLFDKSFVKILFSRFFSIIQTLQFNLLRKSILYSSFSRISIKDLSNKKSCS